MSENNIHTGANHYNTKIPIPSKLVPPTPITKKPSCNIQTQQQHPPPLQEIGHNRSNLMGPPAAVKSNQQPRTLTRSTSLKRAKLNPSSNNNSSTIGGVPRHSRSTSTSTNSHIVKRSISANASSSSSRYQSQRPAAATTTTTMPQVNPLHSLNQDKLVEQICERLKTSENFTTREEFDSLEKTLIDLKTERAQMQFERQKYQDNEKELQWKYRQLERDLEDEQRRRRLDNEDYNRNMNKQSDDIIREWSQKFDDQKRIHLNEIQDEKNQLEKRLLENYREMEGTLHIQHKANIQEMEGKYSLEMEKLTNQIKLEQERANNLEVFIQKERESMIQDKQQESAQWQDKLKGQIQIVTDDYETRLSKCIAEYEQQLQDQLETFQGLKRTMGAEKEEIQEKYRHQQEESILIRNQVDDLKRQLSREKAINEDLCNTLSQQSASSLNLETSSRALRVKIDELQQELEDERIQVLEMKKSVESAQEIKDEYGEKLQIEETLRRKLHNQIQDLKGNIRVYCRVRPAAEYEQPAEMTYPDAGLDSQKISVIGPTSESAMGQVTTRSHQFIFDRVFGPKDDNKSVYNEISQLIQSAMDGYNVCIFCYGQTGSGKTHTMTSPDGVIQRAVSQIYESISNLKQKGWEYNMQGQFIEIYNETINDLLGQGSSGGGGGGAKYEIRHDAKQQRTTVTDVVTVQLTSPEVVSSMLEKAASQRIVAATKANDKSSRSHSVFMLRIIGNNKSTGETCDGTLNLIDLAGSERLNHSQSSGERLKETQSINKSLSCLSDVICALENKQHIPYRNSKLTYLLQYSLGGNSKTLMFVNISPDVHHISESINSLRFATKVNNTKIGGGGKKRR